ncbi:MAG: DUF3267 domain-containing protein [Clostridia bacterium]|nr:DUF3267 domain-containing protein [Clostridia bacterium]
MKVLKTLPANYKEIFSVNLQKDKKIATFINALALMIGLVMVVPMNFYIPLSTLFDFSQGMTVYFIRFVVLMVSVIAYMVLHEAVHGIAMKICGTKKVKYGFTGLYAYAGSNDFYDKKSYIFIALAPVVLWVFILLVINLFVPEDWFWVVYFIQIFNISGAAGDYYVTAKFSKLPDDILISDSGIGMSVYSAE